MEQPTQLPILGNSVTTNFNRMAPANVVFWQQCNMTTECQSEGMFFLRSPLFNLAVGPVLLMAFQTLMIMTGLQSRACCSSSHCCQDFDSQSNLRKMNQVKPLSMANTDFERCQTQRFLLSQILEHLISRQIFAPYDVACFQATSELRHLGRCPCAIDTLGR